MSSAYTRRCCQTGPSPNSAICSRGGGSPGEALPLLDAHPPRRALRRTGRRDAADGGADVHRDVRLQLADPHEVLQPARVPARHELDRVDARPRQVASHGRVCRCSRATTVRLRDTETAYWREGRLPVPCEPADDHRACVASVRATDAVRSGASCTWSSRTVSRGGPLTPSPGWLARHGQADEGPESSRAVERDVDVPLLPLGAVLRPVPRDDDGYRRRRVREPSALQRQGEGDRRVHGAAPGRPGRPTRRFDSASSSSASVTGRRGTPGADQIGSAPHWLTNGNPPAGSASGFDGSGSG